MNPPPSLSGDHLRAYEKIFQHPVSRNLEWREVRSLFAKLCQVDEEPNGNLKVTRNGQSCVLHPPQTKDVSDIDELMRMRRFLQRSDAAAPGPVGEGARLLLVINHHEARIFRSEAPGARATQVLPHEPEAFFRHARDSEDFSRGREKPDPNSFFEPVAAALGNAGRILVFGSGTGESSEMEQFISWLKRHHADVATRIVGSRVIDEHHLTDAQLLAKAQDFYAAV